jgi:hypothetical protein
MKSLHLSIRFALQSSPELRVSQRVEQERGLVALIQGRRYPAAGTIVITSLHPLRHYRIGGAAQGFCRAAADGSIVIALTVDQPSLLVLTSVI